jgi:hypothetical protein
MALMELTMFLYHKNQRFLGHQKCEAFLSAKYRVMVSGIGFFVRKIRQPPLLLLPNSNL